MLTSRKNNEIQFLRKLIREKKFRDEQNLFVIEGKKLYLEALKKNIYPEKVYSSNIKDFKNVIHISPELSEYISDTKTPQGDFFIYEKLKNCIDYTKAKRVFLLENANDPSNIGAIIRTSAAFGLDGILLSDECADEYSPKTIRASMGGIFHISVIRGNVEDLIDNAKNEGFDVVATMVDETALNFFNVQFHEKTLFIFGNEGNGISKKIANLANQKVYIPIQNVESLNLSVTASIIASNVRN